MDYCTRNELTAPSPRVARPHDQLTHGRIPSQPVGPANAPSPAPAAAEPDTSQPAQDASDSGAGSEKAPADTTPTQFLPGDRVRTYYSLDKEWWPGTVIRTFQTKVRGKMDDRIIIIYDDPRYDFDPFEHSIANSTIELVTRPESAVRAQRVQQLLQRGT